MRSETMRMAMGSSLLFFCYVILIHLLIATIAQRDPYVVHYCSSTGNYTRNSTYEKNVDSVLSSLYTDTQIDSGFYNISAGEKSDKVNAIALCRGDSTPQSCRNCVYMAALEIKFVCTTPKEAIIWYMNCTVRYSNNSIFGVMDFKPVRNLISTADVSDVNAFNQELNPLLNSLRNETALGGSLLKYATGTTKSVEFNTIYALMQCTPDLDEQECSDCLFQAINDLPGCCNGTPGARVLAPSCNLRYEVDPFYADTPNTPPPLQSHAPPPSPTPLPAKGKGSHSSRTIITIVVPTVVSAVLIFCICVYLRVSKKRKKAVNGIESAESLQFDFGTIRVSTENFSNENKLGQGGFGVVYKGKLSNGQEIAVKRLSKESGQGDLEFKNEVLLVARLQHRNLVRLLGFCLEGHERLLIYEFVSNASLDHFIFDPSKRAHLDWQRCYKIIVGITRGLLYLHEDSRFRIIHRDLKASNILLDDEMNPKISDFGMARLFVVDQTQGNTNRIVGTYGYMAPEYAMHGHFSVKSDVFSFGVLVLEIVNGQKNSCFHEGENLENLLSFAWKNWREGTASNIIDPTLRVGSTTEIIRCIHIALLCVQENVVDRPTMASVVLMLDSYSMTLRVPSRPAFLMHSVIESDMSSDQSISIQGSANENSITELYPR